jgi:Ca2+-binding RTX toxin-like protein
MSSQATANPETLVNSYTSQSQTHSTVTTLRDGGWVVTWESDHQHGGVYQRRFDADGNAMGREVQVNKYTATFQISCMVTALADGGWITTWESYGRDDNEPGYGYGIYQRRYDGLTGKPIGGETQIGNGTDTVTSSSVTALDDGGWLVTWCYEDSEDFGDIHQQRYDKSGVLTGDEILVNTQTTGEQDLPAVSTLADGGWIVTWTSSKGDGRGEGIFQQRYDEEGHTVGVEVQVNSYTSRDQSDCAVGALSDGGWVVTWTSFGQDGSGYGIYSQRYDADGNADGGETLVNTSTKGYQSRSSLTALADGGWVVTWTSLTHNASAEDIYLQRYDKHGQEVGTETHVNRDTASTIKPASVTAFADGSWVVTWTTYDGFAYGISQRRYAPDILGAGHADTLRGTQWNESLIGNGGNDHLNGMGGKDILIGGGGDDVYVVHSQRDHVQEQDRQGEDTVFSAVTFSLLDNKYVENLTLTGAADALAVGGALNNVLTGNAGDNRIDGMAGKDILKGRAGADTLRGGKESDRLEGGAGGDTFVFASGDGRDTIVDFQWRKANHDTVDLSEMHFVRSFSELKSSYMSQQGSNVEIDFGHDNMITLENTEMRHLRDFDFAF